MKLHESDFAIGYYVEVGWFADEAEAREHIATWEKPVERCKSNIKLAFDYIYQTKGEPIFLFEQWDFYDYSHTA